MLTQEWCSNWNLIWKPQTFSQLVHLADTSTAWCLQVKRVACLLENVSKIAQRSAALRVKSHYAKSPNTCMLCPRWGPRAHHRHFATSGHAAMTTDVSQLPQRSKQGSSCTQCASKERQQCPSISNPSNFSLWALGQQQFTKRLLLRARQ